MWFDKRDALITWYDICDICPTEYVPGDIYEPHSLFCNIVLLPEMISFVPVPELEVLKNVKHPSALFVRAQYQIENVLKKTVTLASIQLTAISLKNVKVFVERIVMVPFRGL